MTKISNHQGTSKLDVATSSSLRETMKKKAVKIVHCPEIRLPSNNLQKLSQKSSSHSSNTTNSSSSVSSSSSRFPSSKYNHEDQSSLSKKEELRNLMKDIRHFNTNMEIGKTKRKIFEDKLTKLGALPPKPQKMPLKLKIELNNARKVKEQKQFERMKESQVINHQSTQILKKKKDQQSKQKRKKPHS